MECSQAHEMLESYLLDTLDTTQEQALESHLDDCEPCSLRLLGDGEALARFASSLPEMQAPERVKQNLFVRIDAPERPYIVTSVVNGLYTAYDLLKRVLVDHAGKSAAALAIVTVVFGTFWYNVRLNEEELQESKVVSTPTPLEQSLFASPISTAYALPPSSGPQATSIVSAESRLKEMTKAQRYLTYRMLKVSTPQQVTFVRELRGTSVSPRPRGMMFYNTSSEALLLALDLPPLPSYKVYQIWLIKKGVRFSAGTFTVDSTGYGQAVIIPVAPLAEFDAIGITIEPSEGSQLPTGTSVLSGDL